MKASRNRARIKYSIVSTDDTNEIINLMSMAKIGQRALVHISPTNAVQISAHDEDSIARTKTMTDHERLDANTIVGNHKVPRMMMRRARLAVKWRVRFAD